MPTLATPFVANPNLTMRMSMRRFTRLTNAFSKKFENLRAAVALHFAHYNLVRLHKTLRLTPAMAAGVTDRVWSLEETGRSNLTMKGKMADIQAQIKQAKAELQRAAESLAIWESFESVTVTSDKGKEINVRSEMIIRCKLNMQKYKEIIAALEGRLEKSN